MINHSLYLRLVHPRPRLLQTLAMGTLSACGVIVGIIPTQLAQAQPSTTDLDQYKNIAVQIEQQRMQDYAEVKRLMGGTVPESVCQRGDIPPKVREICDRFEKSSRDIIQANGMSIPKFNEITRYCQQSPKPKECPR